MSVSCGCPASTRGIADGGTRVTERRIFGRESAEAIATRYLLIGSSRLVVRHVSENCPPRAQRGWGISEFHRNGTSAVSQRRADDPFNIRVLKKPVGFARDPARDSVSLDSIPLEDRSGHGVKIVILPIYFQRQQRATTDSPRIVQPNAVELWTRVLAVSF